MIQVIGFTPKYHYEEKENTIAYMQDQVIDMKYPGIETPESIF